MLFDATATLINQNISSIMIISSLHNTINYKCLCAMKYEGLSKNDTRLL